MDVIIACAKSGIMAQEFRQRGHNAYECDTEPSELDQRYHIRDDIRNHLRDGWDLMIAHPPCKYLANSGVWKLWRDPFRWPLMREAARFFLEIFEADIPLICNENSIMHKYAMEIIKVRWTQTIQPYQFGEPESKRTCLWLKGLPKLVPTNILLRPFRGYWQNQTASGQNRLGPSAHRTEDRARTYRGIAVAMADQWG